MKKLKKSFSALIIVVLMAMVLAPTTAANLNLVITPRNNGTQFATTASMRNGQSNTIIARVRTFRANGSVIDDESSQPTRVSATSPWVNNGNSVSFSRHCGRLVG